MRRTQQLFQAYRQAPWRQQVQTIGLFVAALAAVALVAALYLNVTARAATVGRQVQDLQEARQDMEQEIENLESELAYLMSVESMRHRAEELGFEALPAASVSYLVVPGYQGQAQVQLADRPGSQFNAGLRLPAAYTQSLFSWFGEAINGLGGP